MVRFRNPLLLDITDPELVDRVDKVDTDRPLPPLALVPAGLIGMDESELLTELDRELVVVEREPSRNRRRGGRSISARVGRGIAILVVGCRIE